MSGWLTRLWKGIRHDDQSVHALPVTSRNEDAELAELAALIESNDISEATLERMAKLLGQNDPNGEQF